MLLKNRDLDYGWYYQVISTFDKNEENYMQLFQLFEKDEQAHIRMIACKIANKMKRKDLLMLFIDDEDGHIRKYVMKNVQL